MTTPHLPWSSTDPGDLPQGTAYPGSAFGTLLQDPSVGKFANLGGGRFPSVFFSQPAGSPLNPSMPLGFITDLFAKFSSFVAQADPATIRKPPDLEALIADFIIGLPLQGLGVATNQLTEISAMARRAVSMANEALTKGYGTENGTTPVNVSFTGHRQPLGPQFFVYGDAELVGNQIGLFLSTDLGVGGSYASEYVFTATQMTSDNMIAYAVLGTNGSTAYDTGLYVRCNATATSFVYVNVFRNKLYLGRGTRSGGARSYTDWMTKDIDWNVGDSLGLKADGDNYTVYRGNVVVAEYSDTAHTATKGTSNRFIGGRVEGNWNGITNQSDESFRIAALTFVSLEAEDDTVESLNTQQRMLKSGQQTFASDSLTWYEPGTYSITVESWMAEADFALMGGGGGGGGGNWPNGGAGGNQAAWVTGTWDLSGMVGQNITFTVGAAGAQGDGNGSGGTGGSSSIAATGKTTVTSAGGTGGGKTILLAQRKGKNSTSGGTFVGQSLPGANGGEGGSSNVNYGNGNNSGQDGVAPGAGGGGGGGTNFGGTTKGGKGGAGRGLLQLRAETAPEGGYTQITSWTSDGGAPATITDHMLIAAVVGSGDDEFTITGRCRVSVTSSNDPTMQLRVNGTPIGTAVYSPTGANQDRTCVVYNVHLDDGDEVSMWIQGVTGTVHPTNTDLTITPTT